MTRCVSQSSKHAARFAYIRGEEYHLVVRFKAFIGIFNGILELSEYAQQDQVTTKWEKSLCYTQKHAWILGAS